MEHDSADDLRKFIFSQSVISNRKPGMGFLDWAPVYFWTQI